MHLASAYLAERLHEKIGCRAQPAAADFLPLQVSLLYLLGAHQILGQDCS